MFRKILNMSYSDYDEMLLEKIRKKHIRKCLRNKNQREELKDSNKYKVNRTQAYNIILDNYFLGYDFYGNIRDVKKLVYDKIECGIVDIDNNIYYLFRVLEGTYGEKYFPLNIDTNDLEKLICLVNVDTGEYLYYPKDISDLNIKDKIIISEDNEDRIDLSHALANYLEEEKKKKSDFDSKYNYNIKYDDIINIVNNRLNLKTDFVRNYGKGITYISFDDYVVDLFNINAKKYYVVSVISGDISGMDDNMMWDGKLDDEDLKLLRCLIDVENGEYRYYPDKR